jgi:hypothetical protein
LCKYRLRNRLKVRERIVWLANALGELAIIENDDEQESEPRHCGRLHSR